MNEAQRRSVWARIMRDSSVAPFTLTSAELRQAVDDYDNYMDVVEAMLAGRMSASLRGKLTNAQKRALVREIMMERLNG